MTFFHVARLYAIALQLVVFFVTWAAVSARPWATGRRSRWIVYRRAADPGGTGASREHPRPACCEAPRHVYRVELKRRKRQIAAIESANAQAAATAAAATAAPSNSSWSAPAPPSKSCGIVSTPPVTSTHTS